MLHPILNQILAYLKAEAFVISVVTGIITGIGLLANPVTSPKVFGVIIFLSDWNMLWTWEWWLRMIIFGVLGWIAWWLQKRKNDNHLKAREAVWQTLVNNLQSRLNHTEVLLAAAQVRIEVLSGRRK